MAPSNPHSQSPEETNLPQKPALILVHGFRGSPLGLAAIAKTLRQNGYAVHTPALPPFAGAKLHPTTLTSKTSKNQNKHRRLTYSPTDYADYLRHYIETQNLTQPVLIGHSMGSIVVTAAARQYPKLVNQKLILLSPISTKPPRLISAISPLANYLPRKIVDYITTKFLFVPHDKKLFRKTLDLTHQCSNDQPPSKSELSAAMKFSTSYSIADFLEDMQKDISIIAGERDRLIGQKATCKLANRYHAKVNFIPHSGHLHNYEKPTETAELILKSLD